MNSKLIQTIITIIIIIPVLGLAVLVIAETLNPPTRWNCNAEDEVLIINDTCVHIDDLRGIND